MKRILITGGNGFIAKRLYEYLKNEYEITSISRQTFDLTDSRKISEWFDGKYFDVVIHSAAVGVSRLYENSTLILDSNLQMYYNLLSHTTQYGRFINIGSGAELFLRNTYYGLSKYVIQQSLLEKENFYNIRVFSVFDENELDSRFIKANVTRYINRQHIEIHQNKKMDFFYIPDLLKVFKYYIEEPAPNKEFDCVYENSYYLTDVAEIINSLSTYRVPYTIHSDTLADNYIGTYTSIGLDYVGLSRGIEVVYNKLLQNTLL
jgi:nucleoside-diphosphate-sugar epimerase